MKYIFLLVISSCSMLGPSESKEEVKELQSVQQEQVKQEQKAKEIEKFQEERLNSIEFSLADIKSTLEEMKSFLEQNSEKIKVLEKAFSLGIIPDRTSGLELTDEHFETKSPKKESQKVKTLADDKKSKDSGAYSLKLAEAQNNFSGGKHESAIALYKEIGDTFSKTLTHDNQYYWIGLSYFYLKKFDESQKYLNLYTEYNPKGYWVPYSKYYLASCLKEQGLETKSAMILNKLIEAKASDSEVREMAQYQLRQMKQSI